MISLALVSYYGEEDYSMENIRSVTPNLQQAWLENGTIVWFKLYGSARDTLDDWHNIVTETVDHWDRSQPLLIINDMRNSAITIHGQNRAKEIAEQIAEYHGRVAFVIKEEFLAPMLNMFIHRRLQDEASNIEYHDFIDMDEAVRWLSEYAQV
jgi:hypothetical protein